MNYFSVQWINTGGLKRKQKKTIFRLSESAHIKIPKCIMLGMDAIIVLLLNN